MPRPGRSCPTRMSSASGRRRTWRSCGSSGTHSTCRSSRRSTAPVPAAGSIWRGTSRPPVPRRSSSISTTSPPPSPSPPPTVEPRQLAVVGSVVQAAQIPVIVKLSPFYSSLPGFVRGIEGTGARAVVLFNRFYQPDVDLDALDVSRDTRHVYQLPSCRCGFTPARSCPVARRCSWGFPAVYIPATTPPRRSSAERTPFRSSRPCSSTVPSACKDSSMSCDHVCQHLGYRSIEQARGVLSLDRAPDPHAWERLNYARLLQSWEPRHPSRRTK